MFSAQRPAATVLDESFLEVRAKLLEVAATLDRIDRAAAEASPLNDVDRSRRERLDAAIRLLLDDDPERAEKLQLLFSREYDPEWRNKMGL